MLHDDVIERLIGNAYLRMELIKEIGYAKMIRNTIECATN